MKDNVSNTFKDAGALYDFMGKAPLAHDVKENLSLVNMGYWKGLRSYVKKDFIRSNYALFNLVCKNAQLSEKDELVLDVGCGFGTVAVLCATDFNCKKVIGINISDFQIERAKERVTKYKVDERVSIKNMSATNLEFGDNSISKIISTEAAFHFDSRVDFFKEAYRTLKPGGILSMADVVYDTPKNGFQRATLKQLQDSLYIPAANIYSYEEYISKIKEAGFEIIEAKNITADVRPYFRRWTLMHPLNILINHKVSWIMDTIGFSVYPWEYMYVIAQKK